MASELKRGAIRLGANYTRLGIKFVLAIAFVPIFVVGVGMEGLGLVGLLGSTMGIADLCKTVVRASMKRELGAAYHSNDPDEFVRAYNAAMAISLVLFLVTIALFSIVYAILPLLRISDELLPAAQWMVIAKGTYSALVVILGPPFNMYQVTERMVLHNLWVVGDRVTDFLAAALLFVFIGLREPAMGLTLFALLSSGTGILVLFIAVGLIVRSDPRLVPRPSLVQRDVIRNMLPTTGWNTLVTTAMNLHIRLDQFIMNIFFGLAGNGIFTLAVRLTSYARVAAFGSTDGIDVVSARLSTTQRGLPVSELMAHVTRLHAAIAIPSALLVGILAEPLLNAWVGWINRAIEDPSVIPSAVAIAKILVIGMAVRAIAESWQRVLYGAGFVRDYGPWVVFGGIFNPVIAVALIYLLPSSIAFQGPAIAFASVMVLVNFLWLPRIAARCLNLSVAQVVLPIVKPAVASLLASTILWIPMMLGREESLLVLGITIASFAVVYCSMCWYYVLAEPERERISTGILRRLGRAPGKPRRDGLRPDDTPGTPGTSATPGTPGAAEQVRSDF